MSVFHSNLGPCGSWTQTRSCSFVSYASSAGWPLARGVPVLQRARLELWQHGAVPQGHCELAPVRSALTALSHTKCSSPSQKVTFACLFSGAHVSKKSYFVRNYKQQSKNNLLIIQRNSTGSFQGREIHPYLIF